MGGHVAIGVMVLAVAREQLEDVWRQVQQLARLVVQQVAHLLVALLDVRDGARVELWLDGHLQQPHVGVLLDGGHAGCLGVPGGHERDVQPVLHPLVTLPARQVLAMHHVKLAAEHRAQHARLHGRLDLRLLAEVGHHDRALERRPVERAALAREEPEALDAAHSCPELRPVPALGHVCGRRRAHRKDQVDELALVLALVDAVDDGHRARASPARVFSAAQAPRLRSRAGPRRLVACRFRAKPRSHEVVSLRVVSPRNTAGRSPQRPSCLVERARYYLHAAGCSGMSTLL